MGDYENAPRFFYAVAALEQEAGYIEARIKEDLARAEEFQARANDFIVATGNNQDYLRRLLKEIQDLKGLSDA